MSVTRSIIERPVRETIRPALWLNLLLMALLLGGGAARLYAESVDMADRSASRASGSGAGIDAGPDR